MRQLASVSLLLGYVGDGQLIFLRPSSWDTVPGVESIVLRAKNQPLVALDQGVSQWSIRLWKQSCGMFQTSASSMWYVGPLPFGTKSCHIQLPKQYHKWRSLRTRYQKRINYNTIAPGAPISWTPASATQLVGYTAIKDFFMSVFKVNPALSSLSKHDDRTSIYMSSLNLQILTHFSLVAIPQVINIVSTRLS